MAIEKVSNRVIYIRSVELNANVVIKLEGLLCCGESWALLCWPQSHVLKKCFSRGNFAHYSSSPLLQALFLCNMYLHGFVGQFCHLEICFLSTPRQMPQTITNIPRCLPKILTVSEFWFHLAHSFSRKNVPFDFERAF